MFPNSYQLDNKAHAVKQIYVETCSNQIEDQTSFDLYVIDLYRSACLLTS